MFEKNSFIYFSVLLRISFDRWLLTPFNHTAASCRWSTVASIRNLCFPRQLTWGPHLLTMKRNASSYQTEAFISTSNISSVHLKHGCIIIQSVTQPRSSQTTYAVVILFAMWDYSWSVFKSHSKFYTEPGAKLAILQYFSAREQHTPLLFSCKM